MSSRIVKGAQKGSFSFRVKVGDYEVEIGGNHKEVLKTIKELPTLMSSVYSAFESSKPKTLATLTVKKSTAKRSGTSTQRHPKIPHAKSCGEAVMKALKSDWGKWRPRTVTELEEALKANGLRYPDRTLSRVLTRFVKKGIVRHWKTDAGYVHILAEEEKMG